MTSGSLSWPTCLESAFESVRRERREVERECRAFRRLRQRIRSLETDTHKLNSHPTRRSSH
ncbi:DUF7260 family protein [Halobacterium sp. KA-6]|uniref:DUF7260 family protein n=1 Tax=Halobacterium sp. KA-6 TaxID=2896368 RepID=UPI003FA5394F